MRDNNFDKLLKDKLKGHSHVKTNPDWYKMEDVLHEADKNVHVDSEIRNRLIDHKVTYQPSHWEVLKERLELEKRLKERIIISKFAELVILGLLVFSIWKTQAHKLIRPNVASKDQISSDIYTDGDRATLDIQKLTETIDMTSSHLGNSRNLSAVQTTHRSFGELVNQVHFKEDVGDYSNTTIQADVSIESDVRYRKTVRNTDDQNIPTQVLQPTTLVSQAVLLQTDEKEGKIPSTSVQVIDATEIILDKKRETIDEIPLLDTGVNPTVLDVSTEIIASPTVLLDFREKKELWIGVMTGVDINTINTPIDFDVITEPKDYLAISNTSGVNLSFKKGANEFFTGLGYSIKYYDPNVAEPLEIRNVNTENPTAETTSISYYTRDYTLEKYNIASSYSQYRRHFNHNNRIHSYIFGGIAANFVIHTEFQQQDQLKRGQPRPKHLVDQAAQYQSSDFSKGLLDGGYYKNNIFFTAVAGLGAETQMDRFKFFFEGQYNRNLFASQLGPRNVRLSSMSFNIGAKYQI